MKILRILLILSIVAAMLAPGALAASAGLPNPIHEATREEVEKAAGEDFFLPWLPEGIKDVDYSYIDAPPGDPEGMVIAQAMFDIEGTRCLLRGALTEELEDISGMYYDWTFAGKVRVGVHHGRVMYLQGQ